MAQEQGDVDFKPEYLRIPETFPFPSLGYAKKEFLREISQRYFVGAPEFVAEP